MLSLSVTLFTIDPVASEDTHPQHHILCYRAVPLLLTLNSSAYILVHREKMTNKLYHLTSKEWMFTYNFFFTSRNTLYAQYHFFLLFHSSNYIYIYLKIT